jgi:F-box protein 18 (helicase)
MAILYTSEQQLILDSNQHIVINAVAGSGKTTTLVEYARTRPVHSRILYLAFNTSVKLEAKQKFLKAGLQNVTVETAHSLAYQYIVAGRKWQLQNNGYKAHDLVELLGIQTGDRNVDYMVAGHVNKYMAYWCNSAEARVQQLDYAATIGDAKANAFVRHHYDQILHFTRDALAKMNNGQMAITHDFYLKKMQLLSPVLPYDYILFDEGQDASAAMLDVFLKQPAIKVIVGDVHQQIYSWRYAVNSLQKVDFPSMTLSQSFRFNDEVALVANKILRWKTQFLDWPTPVKINGFEIDVDQIQSTATLGRSNLALMGRAIEDWHSKSFKHVYFEGNINSYTFADDGASLYDILNLQNGKRDGIRDALIANMQSMEELNEYIEQTDDSSLRMMVEVAKKYGRDLPRFVAELKEQHVDTKEDADMIYSTVHRCKGMEYDEVFLLDDFIHESKLKKIMDDAKQHPLSNHEKSKLSEEINLAYVGVTRAKVKLHLPEILNPFKTVQIIRQDDTKINLLRKTLSGTPISYASKDKTSLENFEVNEERFQLKRKNTSANKLRNKAGNAGKPWTNEDDEELEIMFSSNRNIKQLSEHFERSQYAIRKRLAFLHLIDEDFQDEW